jgi:hypothetical protein
VRLRTNFRKATDVYLYRLKASPNTSVPTSRVCTKMKRITRQPNGTHALTNNCTTTYAHSGSGRPLSMNWRILVNGFADELLYDKGSRARSTFCRAKRRAHINQRAQAATNSLDFSARIRTHFPRLRLDVAAMCAPPNKNTNSKILS